jgi:hypothetical protein
VEPHFLPPDTLMFQMLRPSVVVELPDLDPIESLDRFGERRGSVPAPALNNRDSLARARITIVPSRGPQGWQSLAPSRLSTRFDGNVDLLGYRVEQRQIQAGDDLPVTLVWWVSSQANLANLRPVPSLRLVDGNGQVVRSEAPERPLPMTGEGDWVVIRREHLAVPDRAQAGQYTLEAGLIDEETGRSLRRVQPAGNGGAPLVQIRVSAR